MKYLGTLILGKLSIFIVTAAFSALILMACGANQQANEGGEDGGAGRSDNGSEQFRAEIGVPENKEAEIGTERLAEPVSVEGEPILEQSVSASATAMDSTSASASATTMESASASAPATTSESTSPSTAQASQSALAGMPIFQAAQGSPALPTLSGSQSLEDFVYVWANDIVYKWNWRFATFQWPYDVPKIVYVYDQPVNVPQGCSPDGSGGTVFDPRSGNHTPYYCPINETVYWLFNWRIKAGDGQYYALHEWGDFAMVYVIAHELAHHTQNEIGTLQAKMQGTVTSVQTEAQADCLAGVWARTIYTEGRLEQGDYEEAISIAQSVGADVMSPGSDPSQWKHPKAEVRMEQWSTGFETGDPNACTFVEE